MLRIQAGEHAFGTIVAGSAFYDSLSTIAGLLMVQTMLRWQDKSAGGEAALRVELEAAVAETEVHACLFIHVFISDIKGVSSFLLDEVRVRVPVV